MLKGVKGVKGKKGLNISQTTHQIVLLKKDRQSSSSAPIIFLVPKGSNATAGKGVTTPVTHSLVMKKNKEREKRKSPK